MRRTSHLLTIVIFSLTVGVLAGPTYAQNREKFVISAKAGGINAVTGQAAVRTGLTAEWQQLTIKDDLKGGDVVRTGIGGRVEVLLNPGSYLRVGENSEFIMANNSLENLEIKVTRGAAIVEATGADGMQLLINISTPHARMAIVRHGLYRVNVLPEDTELIVRKGRVILNDSQTKINGGNKVVFSGTTHLVAKLKKEEKKNIEELDIWSKERATTLAKANRRISGKMLSSAFASLSGNDFWMLDYRRRAGLWLFNSRTSCYTFVPFFYGWGSPYGSSYSSSVYYSGFGCCGNRGYQQYPNTPRSGGSGNTSSSGGSIPPPSTPPPSSPPPTFSPPTRMPDSRGPEMRPPSGVERIREPIIN